VSSFDVKGQGAVKILNWFLGDVEGTIGRVESEGTWNVQEGRVVLLVQKDMMSVGLNRHPTEGVIGRTATMDVSDFTKDHFYCKRHISDDEPAKIDVYTRVY
jgi:hypothetical protein